MKIEQIRSLIKNKKYSISKHAFVEAFADNFSVKSILKVIDEGEIIEQYEDRKKNPSLRSRTLLRTLTVIGV